MGTYVTLTMRTDMYREIIDDLISYCSNLDNFFEMQEAVHLIDSLEEEYQEDMDKQTIGFEQYQEYEKLFHERFKSTDGKLNDIQINEYKNFHKINKVIEDYKEDGALSVLDTKQQFFLVLDLINSMEEK